MFESWSALVERYLLPFSQDIEKKLVPIKAALHERGILRPTGPQPVRDLLSVFRCCYWKPLVILLLLTEPSFWMHYCCLLASNHCFVPLQFISVVPLDHGLSTTSSGDPGMCYVLRLTGFPDDIISHVPLPGLPQSCCLPEGYIINTEVNTLFVTVA